VHVLASSLLLALLAVTPSCYQRPLIPRDQPLSCGSSDPAECPSGFACVENRICAPEECELAEDCPLGLVCGRTGCAMPGALDGGADASNGTTTDLGAAGGLDLGVSDLGSGGGS
jgi:hypothetical protein